jgi:hypothetical protein
MSTFRSSKTGKLCLEALAACAATTIGALVALLALNVALSNLVANSSGSECKDLDNGTTDVDGDACSSYGGLGCGLYDDIDFSSDSMCCACGGGQLSAPPLPSGNADNSSGEALKFTTLPLGCVASCMPQGAANNLSLPGMPDALPPGCSAIRVDNCTNACAKLAENVVMDQTLLGMIVYWLVLMAPLFSIKPEKQELKARSKQRLLIGVGAINAAVMSWRLIADLFSALGEEDTACLWPHPYYDGASFLLDASGKRFSIFILVALCPTSMTVLQQGVLLPLAWYWANWAREMDESPQQRLASKRFSCLVIVLLAPTVFLCLALLPCGFVAGMFGFPVIGIVASIGLLNSKFFYMCFMALERRKYAKLLRRAEEGDPDAERQLPLFIAEKWESWLEPKKNWSEPKIEKLKMCDSNRPFISRLYFVFIYLVTQSFVFGTLADWGVFLMSWQRSLPAQESAEFFTVYQAFTSEYVDDAYLRFYGRFSLPNYLENFIAPKWWAGLREIGIDLQLFVAVLNSIILYVLSFAGCRARSSADVAPAPSRTYRAGSP